MAMVAAETEVGCRVAAGSELGEGSRRNFKKGSNTTVVGVRTSSMLRWYAGARSNTLRKN